MRAPPHGERIAALGVTPLARAEAVGQPPVEARRAARRVPPVGFDRRVAHRRRRDPDRPHAPDRQPLPSAEADDQVPTTGDRPSRAADGAAPTEPATTFLLRFASRPAPVGRAGPARARSGHAGTHKACP
ncbi:hypothetical protein [Streptomyces sp. NPDC004629]|uniref:hypothetical protein n=1 Tax=Streptomyces sp. NPDC004629 TaxID=3364705 RepID=UPI0036A18B38